MHPGCGWRHAGWQVDTRLFRNDKILQFVPQACGESLAGALLQPICKLLNFIRKL